MSTAQPPLSDTSIPDPPAPELLKRVGLTAEEYERLVGILGRKPNLVEMGICGAMWSEHCSYKTSRRHLKKLPVEGEGVLQGPGENAGAIDLGNDYAVVFKIESHNHPSAVEPFQGAATGVGGIIRDIFAMGARPVALLDSLRFGNLQALEEIGSDVGATRASPENQTPTTSENGGPDERVSGDARVAPTEKLDGRVRVLSLETCAQVTKYLEGVITKGTGKKAKLDRYVAAGKTGTAQIPNRSGSYSGGGYVASFIGYFPAEQPRYLVLVMFARPKNAYYGGAVSAPVFKKVGDRISYIDELQLRGEQ